MLKNMLTGANTALNAKNGLLMLAPAQRAVMGVNPQRNFRQVNNLHEIVYTAQAELAQRTEKYLERTDRVYKPS